MRRMCKETARPAKNIREEAIVKLLRNAKVVTDSNKLAFLAAQVAKRKTRGKIEITPI
jgi:hypothetical protein